MADGAAVQGRRRGRFWLFAPFVLLLVTAIAWSAAWFVIRDRIGQGIDGWIAAEARAGRQWTCADHALSGYPFRIELRCSSLTFTDGRVHARAGALHAVAQVYQPRHIISELKGPLRLSDGPLIVDGQWHLLETSIRASQERLQRASLLIDGANFRVRGVAPEEVPFASERFEAHVRTNPQRIEREGAYDAALSARQARVPALDQLVGGTEPTDVQVDVTATRADGIAGRTGIDEIERWREAGGKLDVNLFSMTKGHRRLEAKGELRLDEERRLAGQLSLAAAGLDALIANLTGSRSGGLLGALLGQAPGAQGGSAPKPLPPVRLENGRVMFGPFVVPGARLEPLY